MKKFISIVAVLSLVCFAVPSFAEPTAAADALATANLLQGDINSGNTAFGAPIPGSVGYGP